MAKTKRLDISMKAQIARLDAVRRIVLKNPKRLAMGNWHYTPPGAKSMWYPELSPRQALTCDTAHCIAGWMQANCADKKIRMLHAITVAIKLAPNILAGHRWCSMLSESNKRALAWLKNREYAK